MLSNGWTITELAGELQARGVRVSPKTLKCARYMAQPACKAIGPEQLNINAEIDRKLKEIAQIKAPRPAPPAYAKPAELFAMRDHLRKLVQTGIGLDGAIEKLEAEGVHTTRERLREAMYRGPRRKATPTTVNAGKANAPPASTGTAKQLRWVRKIGAENDYDPADYELMNSSLDARLGVAKSMLAWQHDPVIAAILKEAYEEEPELKSMLANPPSIGNR